MVLLSLTPESLCNRNCLALVLQHLQDVPLQLGGSLLQYVEADHQRNLVCQMLAGNLELLGERKKITLFTYSFLESKDV